MKLTFMYDPTQEVTSLKAGFRSVNSAVLTEFARRAQQEGVDLRDAEAVGALSQVMLREKAANPQTITQQYQSTWDVIQSRVAQEFRRMFETDWDPGDVTAYLTVSGRCPYSFPKRFFFVSAFIQKSIATSLHELQHFYAHELFEPIFAQAGKLDRFNDFKESLTVVLNDTFADLIETLDKGYEQHAESRAQIVRLQQQGRSLAEIAEHW